MKKFMSLLLGVLLVMSLVPMTVGATADSWNSFVYYQDGPVFSVEATEYVGSGNYTFYAAAYDKDGRLLAVDSNPTAVRDGKLVGEADLEPGNTEANVNIASVKTMVWDGMKPIVENGNFTITAPTAVAGEETYAMTNGFYEAIAATDDYAYCFYLGDGTNEDYSYRNISDAQGTGYDNVLTTGIGFNGIQTYSRMDFVKLSAASEIDRVVTWTYDDPQSHPVPRQTGTEYYLVNLDAELKSTSTPSDIKAVWDGMATDAASANYYYLGTLASEARFVTDDDARTVMDVNSANAYQYLATKKDNRENISGQTYELQAYKKVKAQDIIDAFTANAEYNGLTYYQDGPAFSVEAFEFTTNVDTVKLVATAYDAEGAKLAEVSSDPIAVTAGEEMTLSESVTFEENGAEANINIASVEVKVTDALGGTVLEGAIFDVEPQSISEDGVYNNFTNGFYKPAVDGTVVFKDGVVKRPFWDNHATNYSGANTDGVEEGIFDHNLTTGSQNSGYPCGNTGTTPRRVHYVIKLNTPVVVDRVVAYTSYSGMKYYLSKRGDYTSADYIAEFDKKNTDNVYYLGNRNEGGITTGNDSLRRMMFEADGGTYQYIIADIIDEGAGSSQRDVYKLFDIQPYQKVKATKVVSAFKATAEYTGLVYSQDGPVFSVEAAEFKTNGNSVKLVATAYNSAGAEVATAASDVITVMPNVATTLRASADFEPGETEADVTIASVKVKATTADGATVLLPESTFTVTPNTVVNGEATEIAVNGFYEPVDYADNGFYVYYNSNRGTGSEVHGFETKYVGATSKNSFDNNLTTESGFGNNRGITGFAVTPLAAKGHIDKVMVWMSKAYMTNVEFYVTNLDTANVADDARESLYNSFTPETKTADVQYLGKYGSTATFRTFSLSDYYDYTYIVAKYKAKETGGSVAELQGYVKVQDEKVVKAYATKATWDSVTYSQNGPVFSVAAEGFTTNNENLSFVATAYNADNQPVATKTAKKAFANGALAASVDFEEYGEADLSITKVVVAVMDNNDEVIVDKKTFAVTADKVSDGAENPTYYALTNGFYKPITPSVSDYGIYFVMNYSAQDTIGTGSKINFWSHSNCVTLFDRNINDSNRTPSGNNYNTTGFVGVNLGSAMKIDRVVVWSNLASGNGAPVYVTTRDIAAEAKAIKDDTTKTDADAQALYDAFAVDVNTTDTKCIMSLSGGATPPAVTGRNVADVNSDNNYQYVMVQSKKGSYGIGATEIHAYQKVTETQTVASNK
ncbi:MAG: hypothetical protein E7418_02870 [Ruminococcaceae bacterium]|nr:hypothetical protein [Oscillospiraceae bacterium]